MKHISFKEQYCFELRQLEALKVRRKYEDRIPVIVEKSKHADVIEIDKNKFLAPKSLTLSQFVYVIRKRLKLPPEKALFIFVKNTIPPGSALMSVLYEDFKDDDGFLYLKYAGENTFGRCRRYIENKIF